MLGNRDNIKRDIAEFNGQVVIFGGDEEELEIYKKYYQVSHPRREFYTVDIRSDAKPDLIADVTDSKQLDCLPNNRFDCVYFSCLSLGTREAKTTIECAFRVLNEDKGILVMTHAFDNTAEWSDTLTADEREGGFFGAPKEKRERYQDLKRIQKEEEYKQALQLLREAGFKTIYHDRFPPPTERNTGMIIAFKRMTTDLTNSPRSIQIIIARSLYNSFVGKVFSGPMPEIVTKDHCLHAIQKFQQRSGIANDLGIAINPELKQPTPIAISSKRSLVSPPKSNNKSFFIGGAVLSCGGGFIVGAAAFSLAGWLLVGVAALAAITGGSLTWAVKKLYDCYSSRQNTREIHNTDQLLLGNGSAEKLMPREVHPTSLLEEKTAENTSTPPPSSYSSSSVRSSLGKDAASIVLDFLNNNLKDHEFNFRPCAIFAPDGSMAIISTKDFWTDELIDDIEITRAKNRKAAEAEKERLLLILESIFKDRNNIQRYIEIHEGKNDGVAFCRIGFVNLPKIAKAISSFQKKEFLMGTHPLVGSASSINLFAPHRTNPASMRDPLANKAVLGEVFKFL